MELINEPWISAEDAAKHVDVKVGTVRAWIKNRNMPAVKVGRRWRLKVSEIDVRLKGGQAGDVNDQC